MPKSKKPRKKDTHSREVRARQSLDRNELPIAVHVLEELIASLDEMKHEKPGAHSWRFTRWNRGERNDLDDQGRTSAVPQEVDANG